MTPEEGARLADAVRERMFSLTDSAIAAERADNYDLAHRLWKRAFRLRAAFRRITDRHLFDYLKGTDL